MLAGGSGPVDERVGTGAIILAHHHWTLFMPVHPPHFLWPLHVLMRRPSLGLHSRLCAELMPCSHYTMALLLPTAYLPYSMPLPICNEIDLL